MQQSGRDPIVVDGSTVWEFKSYEDKFDGIESFWSKGSQKQCLRHAQNKCAKSRRRNVLAKASRKKNRKK